MTIIVGPGITITGGIGVNGGVGEAPPAPVYTIEVGTKAPVFGCWRTKSISGIWLDI